MGHIVVIIIIIIRDSTRTCPEQPDILEYFRSGRLDSDLLHATQQHGNGKAYLPDGTSVQIQPESFEAFRQQR